ncbi:MAG: hypothetical protein GVY25_14510 [Bacteroidetes bacterium]|jgi:hypothetical protein|nr:hypothetical protein [Bacteroidota bacterium]
MSSKLMEHARVYLTAFVFVLFAAPWGAGAQSWPTTDWHLVAKDGSELTGARASHGETFENMMEEASAWYAALGYRAPNVERSESGAFLARLKDDPDDITSHTSYYGPPRILLTANRGISDPRTAVERLYSASPVHEIFHAVQWSYPAFRRAHNNADALPSCGKGSSAWDTSWFFEGAPTALGMRWIERTSGQPRAPYGTPNQAASVRYYDQPLHKPHVPESLLESSRPDGAEWNAGRHWSCGYGTWYFWYAAGEMLAEEPGQESEYLKYILNRHASWEDDGVEATDQGFRVAAEAFGSSYRFDEGLYEIYPAFIAEYVDHDRFYESPVSIDLEGRSEVQWHDGTIDPLSTEAFKVEIDVRDDLPADASKRFRVSLNPQPNRNQLHLIEGRSLHNRRPTDDAVPYQFEVPVRGDTTFSVRLANVAEDAATTKAIPYSVRFELGGFYGAPASDPYTAPEVDIVPGFSVMSGPPALRTCEGEDARSAFDLITAAEAVGDVRRTFDRGERDIDEMKEAVEDGEFPIPPNLPPAQREAMRRAMESGNVPPEVMAKMRTALEKAESEMAKSRRKAEDNVMPEMAKEYKDRSRLVLNLVGTSGGESCSIGISAVLRGEEGGAQQLTAADDEDHAPGEPLAVGIADAGYLVGSVPETMPPDSDFRTDHRFEVCMMTPQEREQEAGRRCPVPCSGGKLTLERAAQDHAKGTLKVDLVYTDPDRRDANDCPLVERRKLVVGFNITSANQGQDAGTGQGVSDKALRMMGMDPAVIEMLRGLDR